MGSGSEATAANAFAIAGGTASGADSFAWGGVASGLAACALGFYAYAEIPYKFSFNSGGWWAGVNGASPLLGLLIVSQLTTNATQTELKTDQSTNSVCTLRNNSTYAFKILVSARRTDADGENDAWEFTGLIHRDANAASTTLDALQENHIGSTEWSVSVDADTTNGSLRIQATGAASKTIRWCATIQTTEVTE